MKKLLIIVTLWLGCRVLLDLLYIYIITPLFYYAGLVLIVDSSRIILSYIMTVFWGFVIPKNCHNISDMIFLVLSTLIILPMLSLWGLSEQSTGMLWVAMMGMLIVKAVYHLPLKTIRFKRVKNGRVLIYILFVVLLSILVMPLLLKRGFSTLNFNINKVYQFRDIVHSSLALGGGYLLSWVPKAILPSLIAYSFYRKRHLSVSLLIMLQFILFGLTSHKEFVIYPFVVLFVVYVWRKGINMSVVFLSCINCSLFCLLILGKYLDTPIYVAAIVSRSFHIVAFNHFQYYDFFQNNSFTYWSNSFLKSFISYPYTLPIPSLIGAGRYGEGSEAFANTGFIGSGYMQWGVIGVIIYSIIIGFLLKLAEHLIRWRVPYCLGAAITIVPFMQLVNADLPTAILTHGILVMFVILFLIGDKKVPSLRMVYRNNA